MAKKNTMTNKNKKYGNRILAEGIRMNNNTYETGLNNNDLIVGPSGAGKTMGYVIPNTLNTSDSFIVVDTKSNLFRRTGPELLRKGYRVCLIDFKNPEKSTIGYNPFDFIHYDSDGDPRELDISKISTTINPVVDHREPIWELAAAKYLDCLISYMLTVLREEEHNMSSLYKLATLLGSDKWERMIEELAMQAPDCLAVTRSKYITQTMVAEKMHSSIIAFVETNLSRLSSKELNRIYNAPTRINFRDMGKRKTALFINISDSDRSLDHLLNLFYTQAFQELITSADEEYSDGRLRIPVRLFLDDFAANFAIPDFDGIASVVRSRDIYMSVVLQSLSQLDSMYGEHRARTIINNFDTQLYLGGQDLPTAEYYSRKSNRVLDTVLQLPLDKMMLFIRGQKPQIVDRYKYREIPALNSTHATPTNGKEM